MKPFVILFVCAVLTVLSAPVGAQTNKSGPSFNCAKAGTAVEKALCADPVLGRMDLAMARLYKHLIETDAGLKEDQKSWIKTRNLCGKDTACLTDQLAARWVDLGARIDPGEGAGKLSGIYRYAAEPGVLEGRLAIATAPDGSLGFVTRTETLVGTGFCLSGGGGVKKTGDGAWHWQDPVGAPGCTVTFSASEPGTMEVGIENCPADYTCDAGNRFNGQYKRIYPQP
ncbi:MAG: lysozyme inhibitor LprI family protein [Magnetospiraceae bacterium]